METTFWTGLPNEGTRWVSGLVWFSILLMPSSIPLCHLCCLYVSPFCLLHCLFNFKPSFSWWRDCCNDSVLLIPTSYFLEYRRKKWLEVDLSEEGQASFLDGVRKLWHLAHRSKPDQMAILWINPFGRRMACCEWLRSGFLRVVTMAGKETEYPFLELGVRWFLLPPLTTWLHKVGEWKGYEGNKHSVHFGVWSIIFFFLPAEWWGGLCGKKCAGHWWSQPGEGGALLLLCDQFLLLLKGDQITSKVTISTNVLRLGDDRKKGT